MGKYQKRADKPVVVIPGVGAVANDRVLEGDFDRFVPGLLVKLPEDGIAPAPELESQRPTLVEPEKEPEPDPDEGEGGEDVQADAEDDEEDEEEETAPDMTWLKHELITYAENEGIELHGSETKQELLDLINGAG